MLPDTGAEPGREGAEETENSRRKHHTPQAVISYPILKVPIYSKCPFSSSNKKPFH